MISRPVNKMFYWVEIVSKIWTGHIANMLSLLPYVNNYHNESGTAFQMFVRSW